MRSRKPPRRSRIPHQLAVCMKSGKRRYPDVEAAQEFLRDCAAARARSDSSRRQERRAYECHFCGGAHTTSLPSPGPALSDLSAIGNS